MRLLQRISMLGASKFLGASVASLAIGCASGQSMPRPAQAAGPNAISRLVNELAPTAHVGVAAKRVAGTDLIVEHLAENHFLPASVMKILTAATALDALGPNYTFVTTLLTEWRPSTPNIFGNVILQGSGDPSFDESGVANLAASLFATGVTHIDGDILVNDGVFDNTRWGAGWMWDDLKLGFSPSVSALSYAGNSVVLTVRPGMVVGDLARVSSFPSGLPLHLIHTIVTAAKTAPTSIELLLEPRHMAIASDQEIALRGVTALGAKPWSRRVPLEAPALAAGYALKQKLACLGVHVEGEVRHGGIPAGVTIVAEHRSLPLAALLRQYMKISDNLGMECLLKTVGSNISGEPGTWGNGLAAVRAFLNNKVGLPAIGLSLADGSGLSRYNLVTPAQLVTVLQYMAQRYDINVEFIGALPLGGVDGSLSNRFEHPDLRSRVRAKTGTMTGVSALAGYVTPVVGEPIVFAIMIENFLGSSKQARLLQERIVELLARYPFDASSLI